MPIDFENSVIERSRTIPVLVDFWAPWCGPCRVLGPILDKLAAEHAGTWELCKVNTDEAPAIAQRYGVRGIPSVKLFVDGEVVKAFTGALGEAQVRAWLREALPSSEDTLLREAEALMAGPDPNAAISVLEELLAGNPNHDRARIRLAQLLATTDLPRATSLVESTHADPNLRMVQDAVRTLAETQAVDTLPAGAGRPQYQAACRAVEAHDYDAALRAVIALLQQDRYYHKDVARRLGVAVFTILGPAHELTRRHRRTFDMWLY